MGFWLLLIVLRIAMHCRFHSWHVALCVMPLWFCCLLHTCTCSSNRQFQVLYTAAWVGTHSERSTSLHAMQCNVLQSVIHCDQSIMTGPCATTSAFGKPYYESFYWGGSCVVQCLTLGEALCMYNLCIMCMLTVCMCTCVCMLGGQMSTPAKCQQYKLVD